MNYSMTAAEFNVFNVTLTNDTVVDLDAACHVADYIAPAAKFVYLAFLQMVGVFADISIDVESYLMKWTIQDIRFSKSFDVVIFVVVMFLVIALVWVYTALQTLRKEMLEKHDSVAKDVQALKDLDAQYEDVDEEIPDTSNDHAIARAMAQDAFDASIAHSAKVMAEATEAIESSKRILSSNALPVYQKTDRYEPAVGQMRWDGAVLSKYHAWMLNGIAIM